MLKTPGLAVQVDVSNAASVQAMVDKTVKQFGRIDCALNNAGIEGAREKIVDYPVDMFDRVMNVNLKGMWLCVKYEVAQMLKQERVVSNPETWSDKPELCRFQGQRGSIVNTSSTAGLGAMPEFTPYCSSKWAIIGLTKTVAQEYAKEGIRVNAVCPATTDTPMRDRFEAHWPDWQAKTDASYPVGRVAAPEEVAEAVVWLCSDACPFATGEYLKIAGGR
ncbi:2,5-dichloro-2,5-cyclohexadiene-1,4-diol dehydrogenase-like [Branchiostoma lanceolatum]|uniref:2,5-dichloro-2,5-cyclohexadiene-1,4-diol dehydrogenase-like n=1 Tax=Branchiostoma lanceolatum TaxID=7740 RepID=UPI0034531F19